MPVRRKWSHYFRTDVIKLYLSLGTRLEWQHKDRPVWEHNAHSNGSCHLWFAHEWKGQSTSHSSQMSFLYLTLVTMFCRKGKGRSLIHRLSHRSLSILSFFDARTSFEMTMPIREPNAEASRKSSCLPARPDNPHCKEGVRAKPVARIFVAIFCPPACS